MVALDNTLHGKIRRGLIPLLAAKSVEEKLSISNGLIKSWTAPCVSVTTGLSKIIASPDRILSTLCREMIAENPEIMDILDIAEPLPKVAIAYTDTHNDSRHGKAPVLSIGQKIRYLRTLPLFSGMKIHELAQIAEQGQWMTANQGEMLLQTGIDDEKIHIICEGKLACVEKRYPFEWRAGELVGDIACLPGAVNRDSVRCEMRSLIMVLSCQTFQKLVVNFPFLALNLCDTYKRQINAYHQ